MEAGSAILLDDGYFTQEDDDTTRFHSYHERGETTPERGASDPHSLLRGRRLGVNRRAGRPSPIGLLPGAGVGPDDALPGRDGDSARTVRRERRSRGRRGGHRAGRIRGRRRSCGGYELLAAHGMDYVPWHGESCTCDPGTRRFDLKRHTSPAVWIEALSGFINDIYCRSYVRRRIDPDHGAIHWVFEPEL